MPDSLIPASLLGALSEHALVLVADCANTILEASQPLADCAGYSPAELKGKACAAVFAADMAADAVAQMRAELDAGRAWQGLLHGRRRDGAPLILQCSLLPIIEADGHRARTVMLATDVTARERLRRAYVALVNPGTDLGLFPDICRVVATGLACRGVGVGRLSEDSQRIELLSFWLDGAQHPIFSYELVGTPCEDCLRCGDPLLIVERDVVGRFPRDHMLQQLSLVSFRGAALRDRDGRALGLLFAVDDEPCRDDPDERALLQVAAQRAADEVVRAAVEERLRVSEASMRFALESAELGLHEWNLETGVSRYNERWAMMRGYSPGEPVPEAEDSLMRVHPDDVPRVAQQLRALHERLIDTFSIELRTRTKQGDWRWIDARATTIERFPDGRPRRIVGIQRDIHEARLDEERLREYQQWADLVFDATDLGVWDWNPATNHIVYNERCARLLGYAPGELPANARDWRAMTHPDDLPRVNEQFRAHVTDRTRAALRLEYRTRAKDGRWVWVQNWGRVIERDDDGRAVRAVGIFQDISQLKNAEAALRESEARLRTIVESSPVGIFLCDAEGQVVYRNQTIALIHGTDGADDFGLGWRRFVHPDDLPGVIESWQTYAANPVGNYDRTWRAITPLRGGERLLRIRTAPIRESGAVLGFAGTVEDVTEQHEAVARERRLQQQLQQAQKMEAIGQLTGGIAHDFNNSLATILGFAALALRRCAPEDAKQHQYLDAIRQAGEHARDLVEKMLSFSRSTPREDVQAIDATPLLTEAKRMLQAVIPATMQIDTVIDTAAPTVLIDATAFNQIVFNLVLNARDAIGEHGHIRVCLTAPRRIRGECTACHVAIDGDYVELSVSDDGCGIPSDHLHRIFDPFFSTKEVGKGTGMGLSMLHGIVHRAGGHVIVESSPGAGTTMRVLLQPGAASAKPAPAPAPAFAGHADVHSRRAHVLVIDDNPSVATFMRELLDGHGYRATVFNDPGEALSWLERTDTPPDILVSDQTMPGLTGMELLAAVRPRHPTLPAFLCTGLTDRVDPDQAQNHGVRRVFLKPIQTDEFLAALAACLPAAA